MTHHLTLEEAKALCHLERIHLAQDQAETRRNALLRGPAYDNDTACDIAAHIGDACRVLIAKYTLKDFAILAHIFATVEVTGEA